MPKIGSPQIQHYFSTVSVPMAKTMPETQGFSWSLPTDDCAGPNLRSPIGGPLFGMHLASGGYIRGLQSGLGFTREEKLLLDMARLKCLHDRLLRSI